MTLRVLILLLFSIPSAQVFAQYMSDNAIFSVPDEKACAPYIPVITSAFCAGGGCTFFPDASNEAFSRQLVSGDPIPDFAYEEPGVYTMKVVSGADPNTQVIDFFTITIYANEPPDFNMYTCSGNRVQIEITDQTFPEYSIDYQFDGTPEDTSPSGVVNPFFSYPDSNPRIISVRPNFSNCTSTEKSFTPVSGSFPPSPAVINELAVTGSNTIELALTKPDNFYYQLDMSINSASAWSEHGKITNENTVDISALNTNANYYCFRMGTINSCDSQTPVYTGSNIICSADLDLAVQDDLMQLSWSTSPTGLTGFSIEKNPGGPISIGASPPFAYDDIDIVCGTAYSYQLIHVYPGGIRSYSRVVTGTATSNRIPTTTENISAVNDGTSINLSWLQDPGFLPEAYRIFRITNNTSRLALTTPDPLYTDNNFNKDDNICYSIQYTDICGNQSLTSNVVCPIVLSATLLRDNTVSLEWSPYNGWAAGVDRYEVDIYDENGVLAQTISTGTATSYIHPVGNGDTDQVFTYRIRAIAADGSLLAMPAISNPETIVRNPNLGHPTAFIPSSRISANSSFRVFGSYISEYHLKIFNRWGELLFESFDKESGWDGTFRGQRMPEGTYVFQARITDRAGRNFDYAGTVVLLKKG